MVEDALANTTEQGEEEEEDQGVGASDRRASVASGGSDLAVGVAVTTNEQVELKQTEIFPPFGMR